MSTDCTATALAHRLYPDVQSVPYSWGDGNHTMPRNKRSKRTFSGPLLPGQGKKSLNVALMTRLLQSQSSKQPRPRRRSARIAPFEMRGSSVGQVGAAMGTISGSMAARQTVAKQIGTSPGFGLTGHGLSSTMQTSATTGVQSADQGGYCPLNPTSQWTTLASPAALDACSGYCTGAVANTIASVFANYFPKRAKIRWIPELPTSAAGQIAFCVQSSSNAAPAATSITQILDSSTSVCGPIWQPLTLEYDPGALPVRTTDLLNTNGDDNFVDNVPIITFMISGATYGSGSAINAGRFEVSTEWSLYNPGVQTAL